MKLNLALALVLLTAVAPAFAEPHSHAASSRMRPQLFHDRTPHARDRGAQPHHQA